MKKFEVYSIITIFIILLFFLSFWIYSPVSFCKFPSSFFIDSTTCVSKVAINENNPGICLKAIEIETCFEKYYEKDNSSEFCEELKENEIQFQINARDYCFLTLAKYTSEINLCEKINRIEEKDMCYSFMAKDHKSDEICNEVSLGIKRDICLTESKL
ncbi:hypothetical protein [Candidatus Venteria ishoeyi]|uniref:Uncharacterized protein n=1 Tax=Candidatus Venteria ishoeyi TaxID=1899563 RepID=A0A1H6F5S6_9GAMM|nr:hypothetical protein [Candidatus Venteria ishoeyi]SEH05462.1 Uncharacterised protein [Candidatus Venteria ishoeyi]